MNLELKSTEKQEASMVIPLSTLASCLFENSDSDRLKPLLEIDFKGVTLGMTPFQIRHFVLNRKEFCTDFAQFQQAKLELYHRVMVLFDLYYQYRKASAEIKLAEGEIERLMNEPDGKIKEAKIELQEIEIEKNQFQILNIKKQAKDKLAEALVFYDVYQRYKYFDEMSKEELEKYEEESWKIKSAYYPELTERYGLTPNGILKLPHEEGGIEALTLTKEIEKAKYKYK